MCIQAKENRKFCWAPLSGLGQNNAVLASTKSPGLHLQLLVLQIKKGILKSFLAIVQMQNTEVHNALPVPPLSSPVLAKYIKGGALAPQSLRAENSFFIFTVTYRMLALHLFLQVCLYLRPVFF